jgi:para-nitrobenzyl esterase
MACKTEPVTPDSVTASDGAFGNKIVVTWTVRQEGEDQSQANDGYRVYRSKNIQTGFQMVGDKISETMFEDKTAEADTYYYYRIKGVVVTKTGAVESELSVFDQGYRGRCPYAWLNQKNARTKYGDLKGKTVKDDEGWAWLGIPYARPPVENLRWKAPREPEPWDHELDATEFCAFCPQYGNVLSETGRDTYNGQVVGDEDCLYLNIWRPQSETKLPVYVFVHGGANVFGRSDLSIYDGANFAIQSNMVFVSLNYRLAHLGWFRHESMDNGDPLDASGNYGTLDILKALEWIRENIAAFGGDPDNVTLTGQSAGAINTYSMMVCPMARNLFHRAIPMSGFPLSMPVSVAENRGTAVITRLLKQDGYADSTLAARRFIEARGDEWIATYLRSKSIEELMPPNMAGPSGFPLDGGLGIIAAMGVYEDGLVIPDNMYTCLKQGNYNRVPILVGNTTDEIKLFLPMILGDPVSVWDFIQNVNPDAVELEVSQLLYPVFLPLLPFLEPVNHLSKMVFQGYGVDSSVRSMSENQDNLFVYKFAWDEEPQPLDIVLGAAHALDIPFVFNTFISEQETLTRLAWSEENRPGREYLSDVMMRYFAQFARTGDPNTDSNGLLVWTPWNPEDGADKRIVFDTCGPYMSPDVVEEDEKLDLSEMIAEMKILFGF